METGEKSQQHFSLFAISQKLLHSNLSSILVAMNFQTPKHILRHPVVRYQSKYRLSERKVFFYFPIKIYNTDLLVTLLTEY